MKRSVTSIVITIFMTGFTLGVVVGWIVTLLHREYILKLIGQ